jgi:hypothetical protein
MIFLSGFARTGTSVLFKCLQNSGFNGGNNLWGHKYETQDIKLNRLRSHIGTSSVLPQLQSYGETQSEKQIEKFFVYCTVENIEILKDPHLWLAFKKFYDYSDRFRKSKFIWTMREPLEIAKSQTRLQCQFDVPPVALNGKLTVQRWLRLYGGFEKIYEKFRDRVDSLVVNFEDLVYRPESIKAVISKFIGRTLDISAISPDETFKARRVAQ